MITIESVELVNVRSIGRAVVEPLTDGGVTALNGPRGVGKSTVLIGLLYALFGTTPDGVPAQALRRQGSEGEVKVVVTFVHGGQRVVLERGLKGRNDTPYAKVTLDGVEQTVGKIRAANEWVVRRFGDLDATGFLAAFVVRQKELDALVKARAADRRALFERLAGIDRMSDAVKAARAEEAAARTTLEHLPGSAEEVDAARADLQRAQEHAARAWEEFETASAAVGAEDEALALARERFEDVTARVRVHQEAAQAAQRAEHHRLLTAERAEHATREVDRLTAASAGGSAEAVHAARAALTRAQQAVAENQAARAAARTATAAATADARRAQQAQAASARSQTALTAARAEADEQARLAAAVPADLPEQVQAATARAAELQEQRGVLRGEYQRLEGSIKALSATVDPTCPTCSTPLADPHELLQTLRTALDRVREQGLTAKAEQEQADGRAQALTGQIARAQQLQQAAGFARQRHEAALAAAQEAEAVAAALQAEAAASAQDAQQAQARAEEAAAAEGEVQAAFEAASARLRQAESAAEAAAALGRATTSAQEAQTAAAAAVTAAEQAAALAAAAAVPDTERVQAQAALTEAGQRVQDLRSAMQTAQAEHRLAEQQVKHSGTARDQAERRLKDRAAAAAEYERRTAVREALDTFRKDRIARLAPEVSEVATDLIARMTSGRYVSIELDEEFTAVVTDDTGQTRPVTWLSGGEESVVAFALRVALGELWAGQRGGLLFLDEPFTAQDVASRTAMMAAIRDLPNRQVILINHASEATDMVDLVLDVVPDEETGARIEAASAFTEAPDAVLAGIDEEGFVPGPTTPDDRLASTA
ncbi:AAA family ATPase [Kineococcus aurantiacus]|uniref:Nuclease SbcCD subunit C n=1 Tax=Kineococcus aurantiacus TaxID=37633 RepID=A0A7Y9J3C2_9ACTN|nr:SMC family ATPase [Kineococcus aurantiacus]NYD24863.1 exonuclease SbcC [Kineococcus aurantiacus]